MKGWWTLVGVLLVIIIVGTVALVVIPAPKANAPITDTVNTPATSTMASLGDLIVVTSPLPNAIISSTTITITGKARGTWYFEASFPIEVDNFGGTTIGQGHAEALSNWMTNDYVPFSATIHITSLATDGTAMGANIILKNDNPSGDPTKDKSLTIPIEFRGYKQ